MYLINYEMYILKGNFIGDLQEMLQTILDRENWQDKKTYNECYVRKVP